MDSDAASVPGPTALQQEWEERYASTDHAWSGRVNDAVAATAGALTPGTALDVGCGEGGDAAWLAAHGWQVTGLDLSPTAVERARQAAPTATFASTDVTEWTGRDGGYDLVLCAFLHTHGDADRAVPLRAAAAHVAPGGRMLVVSHAEMPPWARPEHADHPHPHTTPDADRAVVDPDGAWQVEASDIRPRPVTTPDGRPATLDDSVLLMRRPA